MPLGEAAARAWIAARYYASLGFGWVRSFRAMGDGRYVYAQAAPGHTADSVRASLRERRLVRLEGWVRRRDAGTGRALSESRFHRLVQMPPRADAATVRLRVAEGILMLEMRERDRDRDAAGDAAEPSGEAPSEPISASYEPMREPTERDA